MSQPPQLQLSLPPITTFKRSFAQFGFELDSPGTAAGSSSNEGSDGTLGNNSERNKRARSDPGSGRLDDRQQRRRTGRHRVQASSSGSSSAGATPSGQEASGSNSTIDSDSPRSEPDEFPVNEHPPRLPTPEIQDIEMLPEYPPFSVPIAIPGASRSLSPAAASESWSFESEGNETNILLVSSNTAPRIPISSLATGVTSLSPTLRSPSANAASQEERFHLTLERFNTFDGHMSALRHTPEPQHDEEDQHSPVSSTHGDPQPAMSSPIPIQHISPPQTSSPAAGPSSAQRQNQAQQQSPRPMPSPTFSRRGQLDFPSLTNPRSPLYTPLFPAPHAHALQSQSSLEDDEEHEDRLHRLGQEEPSLQPYIDIFHGAFRSPTPPPTLPPLEGRLGPRLDMPEFEEELREVHVNAGVLPSLSHRDCAGCQQGVQRFPTSNDDDGAHSSSSLPSASSSSAIRPADSIASGSTSRTPMPPRVSSPLLANPVPSHPTGVSSPRTRPSSTRPWEREPLFSPWQSNSTAAGNSASTRPSSPNPPPLQAPVSAGPSSSLAGNQASSEPSRRSPSPYGIVSDSEASPFSRQPQFVGGNLFSEEQEGILWGGWADDAVTSVGVGVGEQASARASFSSASSSEAEPTVESIPAQGTTSTSRRVGPVEGGDFFSRLDEALHRIQSNFIPPSDLSSILPAAEETGRDSTIAPMPGSSTQTQPRSHTPQHPSMEGLLEIAEIASSARTLLGGYEGMLRRDGNSGWSEAREQEGRENGRTERGEWEERSVFTEESAGISEGVSSSDTVVDAGPPQLPPLRANVTIDFEMGADEDNDEDMERNQNQAGGGGQGREGESAHQLRMDRIRRDLLHSYFNRRPESLSSSRPRLGLTPSTTGSEPDTDTRPLSAASFLAAAEHPLESSESANNRAPELSRYTNFDFPGSSGLLFSQSTAFPPFGEAPPVQPPRFSAEVGSQGSSSSTRSIAGSADSSPLDAREHSSSRAISRPSSYHFSSRNSVHDSPSASLHAREANDYGRGSEPRPSYSTWVSSALPHNTLHLSQSALSSARTPAPTEPMLRVEHQPPSPLLHELHQWLSPPEPESPTPMSNSSEEAPAWWRARVASRDHMDVDVDSPQNTERDRLWARATRHPRNAFRPLNLAPSATPSGTGSAAGSLNAGVSSSVSTSWDLSNGSDGEWDPVRGDGDRRTAARRRFELQRPSDVAPWDRSERMSSQRRPAGAGLPAPSDATLVSAGSSASRQVYEPASPVVWDNSWLEYGVDHADYLRAEPRIHLGSTSSTTRQPDTQSPIARPSNTPPFSIDPINLTDPVYSTHRADIDQPPLPIRFSGFSPHFAPQSNPAQPSNSGTSTENASDDTSHNPYRPHFRLSSNSLVAENAAELRIRTARAELIQRRTRDAVSLRRAATLATSRSVSSPVLPQSQNDMPRDASFIAARTSQSLASQQSAASLLLESMRQDRVLGRTSEEDSQLQEAPFRRRSSYREDLFLSRSRSSSPARNPVTFEAELEHAAQRIFGSEASSPDEAHRYSANPMDNNHRHGAAPYREIHSLPSPDLGRVFDSHDMSEHAEALASYLNFSSVRHAARLDRGLGQVTNGQMNTDRPYISYPELSSSDRRDPTAVHHPTVSPASIAQASSRQTTAGNGTVGNMDPNMYHPGPFRNTIRHYTQAHAREERLRAVNNPPPTIPPLSLGGTDFSSVQSPMRFNGHPPPEPRTAAQHAEPIPSHSQTTAARSPPAADVHRLLMRRARLSSYRSEHSETNTNSSRGDAEGFSHAIEILRADGLSAARSQRLMDHYRREHPDTEPQDTNHRHSQPPSSSNERPSSMHHVRAEARPAGHQAHGRYMPRSDTLSMFGPGRRRRMLSGRPMGDYMRDEDFDPSYEGLMSLAATLGEAKPKSTPAEVISGLQTGLYKDWQTPDSDKRCPICLDDYESEDTLLKLAECSHWMHRDCLHQWLNGASTCPVCRKPVSPISPRRPPRYRNIFGPPDATRPNMRRDPHGQGGGGGAFGPFSGQLI